MKCINCNQEIDNGARLCRYCGAAQPFNPVINDNAAATPEQLPPLPGATPEQVLPVPEASSYTPSPQMPESDPNSTTPLSDYDNNPEQPSIEEKKPKKKGMSGLTKALIALAVLLALACAAGAVYYFFFYNKVERLNAKPDKVKFDRTGGKKKVKIKTDAKKFEVTDCPDWLDVDIDDDEITIKCDSLEHGGKDRKGTIEISAGAKTTTIKVVQSSDASYIDVTSYEAIGAGGGGGILEVSTDGDVENFDINTDVDWIEASPARDNGISWYVRRNDSSYSRTGTITISSGDTEARVIVEQAGYCSYCSGAGEVTCSVCYGSGKEYYYGEYYPCEACDGTGKTSCPYCGGPIQ